MALQLVAGLARHRGGHPRAVGHVSGRIHNWRGAGETYRVVMAVQLNHHIVHVSDRRAAAASVTEILGLDPPTEWGPFCQVRLANDVELDFADDHGEGGIQPTHYAFLVTEAEFDEILGRIVEREIPYWADPMASRPGEINHNDGGRGVYWKGPDGHFLEIITRPYGSGG